MESALLTDNNGQLGLNIVCEETSVPIKPKKKKSKNNKYERRRLKAKQANEGFLRHDDAKKNEQNDKSETDTNVNNETDRIAPEEGTVKNVSDEPQEPQPEIRKERAPHHFTLAKPDTVIASPPPPPSPQQPHQEHHQEPYSRKRRGDTVRL